MTTEELRAIINDPNRSDVFPALASWDQLPDVAPTHHPLPWHVGHHAGNGRCTVVDANDRIVAPVLCWEVGDSERLAEKLARINGVSRRAELIALARTRVERLTTMVNAIDAGSPKYAKIRQADFADLTRRQLAAAQRELAELEGAP